MTEKFSARQQFPETVEELDFLQKCNDALLSALCCEEATNSINSEDPTG
ncbi:MAG: hypothetical protein GXP25_22360 [Planctomycetes bacterium]|nr:hypothetical protein [Planctomycetota bacterium]